MPTAEGMPEILDVSMVYDALSGRFKTKDACPDWWVVVLVLFLIAAWSALFSQTFTRPFNWDDLHLIRHYSLSELLSTLHGPEDPDGVETPAWRPVATLIFHLQGIVFGEDMLLQRAFMIVLMGGLLLVVGVLLRELGLSFPYIAVVLVLFTSSRVFASLVLWITNGALIFTYILMALAALFYLRWTNGKSAGFLTWSLVFTALAVMTREEAYTLPLALPLLWWLSSHGSKEYWRPTVGALATFAVILLQYILRAIFVPDAPQPGLHFSRAAIAVISAWFPGGAVSKGWIDKLIEFIWICFLLFLAALTIWFSDRKRLQTISGICALGLVLSAPALGVAREFGTALPSLAFFTVISIAVVDILKSSLTARHDLARLMLVSVSVAGLILGIVAGIRRSVYVARSLDQNAIDAVIANGKFVFNMFARPVTIPAARRQAMIAHLSELGVQSRDDIIKLIQIEKAASPQLLKPPMFAAKYNYLSF